MISEACVAGCAWILRELRRRNGGFFGSGESTGSVGVVTLNLPTKAYLGTFVNHFSTIGIVGGNEMCLNAKWLGKDLSYKESQDFVEKLLHHMRNRLSDYQEMYAPDLYNMEATPAESTAFRFAKHDKKNFPDIITANDNGTPYYTNSTNLPVGCTDNAFDAHDIQDRFQPLYTSGTVFHTFLGEKLPSWESAACLVRKICGTYKLPYVSISPTYSVCTDHGYFSGEHFKCPVCGKEAEVYSRITGYYRPVKNWNDGKVQEFKDRKVYQMESGRMKMKPQEKVTPAVNSTECNQTASEEYLLFTTATCPNCKLAKDLLDRAGIAYLVIDAMEDLKLTEKFSCDAGTNAD